MNKKNPPRISISKTQAEWKVIFDKIGGEKKVKTYILSNAHKLSDIVKNSPDTLRLHKGQKKRIQVHIPEDVYSLLKKMASDMERPLDYIIDDFFFVHLTYTPK